VGDEPSTHDQLSADARGVLEDHHDHPDVRQAVDVVPEGVLVALPVSAIVARRRGRILALQPRDGSYEEEEEEEGGAIMAGRQAALLSMPLTSQGFARHRTTKIWVTPPPRLPQPAAVA
jgi:hypothetical protein